jgi:hypothetical protein
MKHYEIDIHPSLRKVRFSVKNGAAFERAIINGEYKRFTIIPNEYDAKRIKKFAVKFGNDKSSNHGNWYAHCNGYAMDLLVTNGGTKFEINTYRPYGARSN